MATDVKPIRSEADCDAVMQEVAALGARPAARRRATGSTCWRP